MIARETTMNTTSSIGAVWPPQPSSNDRLKGFYPAVIATPDQLAEFEQDFWQSHDNRPSGLTRTTVRVVGSSAMLDLAVKQNLPVEAAMELAGNSNDLQMIYLGINSGSRELTSDFLGQHQAVLAESRMARSASHSVDDSLHIHTATGSDSLDTAMHDRFAELYTTFGFSDSDVTELLQNPHNTVAYLEDSRGNVLSTCLAEHGIVELGQASLSLYEITEAVTHPDARGHGYYTAVSGALGRVTLVQARHDAAQGMMVGVYGESNLSAPGVIRAARHNQRRFSSDQAPVGLAPEARTRWGILQQNYKINDGADPRDFNDFALSYLPVEPR